MGAHSLMTGISSHLRLSRIPRPRSQLTGLMLLRWTTQRTPSQRTGRSQSILLTHMPPRQIDNPDYKGAWVHPEIDNPEYNAADADGIAKYAENCRIGLDLWQVKSGTIFDNVMITDDAAAAKKAGEDLWAVPKDAEKTMKDAQDEEE